MGLDIGFDMCPLLTSSTTDVNLYSDFLRHVKNLYKNDAIFVEKAAGYEFNVGEHPWLPFDGTTLARFSSKYTGRGNVALSHIKIVYKIAQLYFGDRAKLWDESNGHFGDIPEVPDETPMEDICGQYDWDFVRKTQGDINERSKQINSGGGVG